MTKSSGKLAAMAAAACLIATVAIPAYAAAESPLPAAVRKHQSTQSLVNLHCRRIRLCRPRRLHGDHRSRSARPSRSTATSTVNPPAQAYSGAAVLAYAAQFVGKVPYGMGNSPTTSFSCDGFTQYILPDSESTFPAAQITRPRSA